MLPLLISKACSMRFNYPTVLNDKHSLFDVSITNDNWDTIKLTKEGRGFFVGFRYYYDNGTVSPVQLMTQRNQDFEDIRISYYPTYATMGSSVEIRFTVRNKGYFAKKIDLGVFFEPNFNEKDNGPIRPVDGKADYNRGYLISSKDSYNYSLLLRNVGETPNADTIYIKDMGESTSTDPHFFPFFKNEVNSRTSNKTVIAFSWLNQEITVDSDKDYVFKLLPGDKVNTAPRLFDLSNLSRGGYEIGSKVSFKFEAVDFDESDKITISCTIRGLKTKSFSNSSVTTPGHRNAYLTIDDYVIDKKTTYIKCSAKDSSKYSNYIDYYIFSTQVPIIKSVTGLKPKYYIEEEIKLKGEVEDDTSVYIYYRINQGPKVSATYRVTKNFEFTIPLDDYKIKPYLKTRQNYTIYIWAEDTEFVESEPVALQFYLRAPENPQLLSVFTSNYAYERGKVDLVIFGEANDADEGQLLNFYSQFSTYPRSKLGEHRNGDRIIPFAFSFDVPADAKPGIHPLTLDIVDDTNLTGDFNRSVDIRICGPGESCYEPGEEPTIEPSSINPSSGSKAPNEGQEDDNPEDKYKSKMPIVWVLTVFNIIAVIVLLVIGVFYIRKKMNTYDAFKDDTTTSGEDEISESNITPTPGKAAETVDNPLFSSGIPQSDDVFANDYHEETTVDVFKFNNDEDDPDLGI